MSKPGEKRFLITLPTEMHDSLRRVAEERTEASGGVIKYSLAMVAREAIKKLIDEHDANKKEAG